MSSHTEPGWHEGGMGELPCGCGASSDGCSVKFCSVHAAGPELLEALEEALRFASSEERSDPEYEFKLAALIAKAKGEQS